MRLLAFIVGLLIAGPSFAQPKLLQAHTAAASYTGPGDVKTGATVFYGIRAYNAAWATGSNKSVNIRRASDNATTDVLILASGAWDQASAATFCAATSCFVTKFYDQSGAAADASQATAGNQIPISFSCSLGSFGCFAMAGGTNTAVTGAVIPAIGSTVSTIIVYNETNAAGTNRDLMSDSSGNRELLTAVVGAGISAAQAASFVTATATDNVWHAIQGILNGASSGFNVDGTFTPGATSPVATGNTLTLGGNPVASFTEMGLWPGAFNATEYGNLCHNQFIYYGTATSC